LELSCDIILSWTPAPTVNVRRFSCFLWLNLCRYHLRPLDLDELRRACFHKRARKFVVKHRYRASLVSAGGPGNQLENLYGFHG